MTINLRHLATNTMIVSRMTTVSGSKKTYATVTSARVTLQPLSAEKTELVGGIFGKTWKVFADVDIDIQAGDLLRDDTSGDLYKVKSGGVSKHMMGCTQYLEVIIEITKG